MLRKKSLEEIFDKIWPMARNITDLQNHGTMDLQQVKAGFQLVVACFVIRCGLVATLEIFEGNL